MGPVQSNQKKGRMLHRAALYRLCTLNHYIWDQPYRSASLHVKPKKRIPMLAIDRIKSRVTGENVAKQEEIKEEKEAPKIVNHTPQNQTPAPQPEKIVPVTYTLVSDRVDWSKVSACVSSKKQCICYGHSVERLVIPDETCRLASKHGFPRSPKPTTKTHKGD